MKTIARNAGAVIAGIIIGSIVNILLVNLGPYVVPLPESADVSTPEALAASMPLFGPANFIFPFLGHAIGTLVGAFVAAKLAGSHRFVMAMIVAVFFLAGGIAAAIMLGGPVWFTVLDLVVAYIPMGMLAARLAGVRLGRA